MTEWIDKLVSEHTRKHIAWVGETEFCGAAEDDRTGRTVQFRLVRKPEELLAAHPFATYTRRRRGHAGTRFEAVFNAVEGWQVLCEVMLLNWGDGPGGATVKFLLDLALDDHPFLKCTRRAKEKAGTAFMVVFMEVDDDNTIVNQEQRERVEGHSKQHLSNVAAMMVKNNRLHLWLREIVDEDIAWDTQKSDQWLKETLSISSKAELDNEENIQAISGFHRLRAAFVEWQERQGYPLDE
jgi:hypothetical protein